jgi:hypothetical protein
MVWELAFLGLIYTVRQILARRVWSNAISLSHDDEYPPFLGGI